jgi:hypothetical protein
LASRTSIRAERFDRIRFRIAPFERIDANDLEILGELFCVRSGAERTYYQPGAVRALCDAGRNAVEQVAAFRLDAPEMLFASAAACGSTAAAAARRERLVGLRWLRRAELALLLLLGRV